MKDQQLRNFSLTSPLIREYEKQRRDKAIVPCRELWCEKCALLTIMFIIGTNKKVYNKKWLLEEEAQHLHKSLLLKCYALIIICTARNSLCNELKRQNASE